MRVNPPHERLGALHCSIRIDERLQIRSDLTGGNCVLEGIRNRLVPNHLIAHRIVVICDTPLVIVLDGGKRHERTVEHDVDRRVDRLDLVHAHVYHDRLVDILGPDVEVHQQVLGALRIEYLCGEHVAELIAANAAVHAMLPRIRAQEIGDMLEHLVAEFLAIDVVDDLEILDVDGNEAPRFALGCLDELFCLLIEVFLVVYPGEGIEPCKALLVGEFLLFFGDIANGENVSVRPFLGVENAASLDGPIALFSLARHAALHAPFTVECQRLVHVTLDDTTGSGKPLVSAFEPEFPNSGSVGVYAVELVVEEQHDVVKRCYNAGEHAIEQAVRLVVHREIEEQQPEHAERHHRAINRVSREDVVRLPTACEDHAQQDDEISLHVYARYRKRLIDENCYRNEEYAVCDNAVDHLASERDKAVIDRVVNHGRLERESMMSYRIGKKLDGIEYHQAKERLEPEMTIPLVPAIARREQQKRDHRPVKADEIQVAADISKELVLSCDDDNVSDDGREQRHQHYVNAMRLFPLALG